MTMHDKMRTLVHRLLQKTVRGELQWSEAPSQDAFQVSFPSYSVEVEQTDGGTVLLKVYDAEGRILDATSDAFIKREDKEQSNTSDDADRLIELYRLARRHALKVENALDELLARLA